MWGGGGKSGAEGAENFIERFEQRFNDFREGKPTFVKHFRDRNVVAAAFFGPTYEVSVESEAQKSSSGEGTLRLVSVGKH